MYFEERIKGVGDISPTGILSSATVTAAVATAKKGVDWFRMGLAAFTAFQFIRKSKKKFFKRKRRR